MKNRWTGITFRTALLSWLVTTATLLIFVTVIIPEQKRTFIEHLNSKAIGVIASLQDVATGAAVSDDYSSVVEHCQTMLKGDDTLDYLVVTKNEGESLINIQIDLKEFDLDLISVENVDELPQAGNTIVTIARINTLLHFRVFRYDGEIIFDKGEKDLSEVQNEIDQLKTDYGDLWDRPKITGENEAAILASTTSITKLTRPNWKLENKISKDWRPSNRVVSSGISVVPLFDRRVFHYSQPFDYHSGIEWGWIHVGLSLDSYDRSVAAVYRRTSILAVICVLLSLAASVVYAKRLVQPILSLRTVVQKVAGGDLAARAPIQSSDEVGNLAHSFNSMAETLLQRDQILQSVRFAAQQFLSTADWKQVIGAVLAEIGEAAGASRAYVFENHMGDNGNLLSSQLYEWAAAGVSPQINNPNFQNFQLFGSGFDRWSSRLERGITVSMRFSELEKSEKNLLEPQEIQSLILIPVTIGDSWWGILGLDECNRERVWTAAERDSLGAAANMLGAAIERQRTQAVLLEAKEAAEAANRAKSQFLANMSHEIRTPITGVMGMLQLMQGTGLEKKQARYVSQAFSATETLMTVIGDVLDVSKIEAGRFELNGSSMSVINIIDSAIRLFAEQAERKEIELVYRVDSAVPDRLHGDSNRLRQILINLVGNAVKFSEHGEIIVNCDCREASNGHVSLYFEVRDKGCGIAEENHSRIFEAFTQTDSSMTRAHSGTGLGLAISRQLCELMDGEIGVNSELGEGATFWFTVRLKIEEVEQRETSGGLQDLNGMRVLVVDDSQTVCELVREYIQKWNGVCEDALDAALAMHKLRTAAQDGQPFATALLDWNMPGLDGTALAKLVKEDAELKDTHLVLMTNFSGREESEIGQGFAGCVAKPLRSTDLYETITASARPDFVHLDCALDPSKTELCSTHTDEALVSILLAEDNELNREVVTEMITGMGYRCMCVGTGLQAVEAVKSAQPRLLLMDCQMPGMDGYEATRTIRRWENEHSVRSGRGRMPIVALTAHAIEGDRDRCIEAGMDDYLKKPLDSRKLAETLSKWVTPGTLHNDLELAEQSSESYELVRLQEIEHEQLLQRCSGKNELANRLIRKFLQQSERDLLELDLAVQKNDPDSIFKIAHRLTGAAGIVVAKSIQRAAAQIETAGRKKEVSKVPALFVELRNRMRRLKESFGGC